MQVDPENRGSQFRTDFDKPVDHREVKKEELGALGRFFVRIVTGLKNLFFGHKKNDDLPQVGLSSRNASPKKITMNWMSDESSESGLSPKFFLPGEESVSSYDRQDSTDSAISVSSFSTFKGEAESPVGYSDQPSKGLLNSQVSDDLGFYDDDFPPPPTPEELNEPDIKPSRTPDEAWEDARKSNSFSTFKSPTSPAREKKNEKPRAYIAEDGLYKPRRAAPEKPVTPPRSYVEKKR